jgi:hypothetical protein
MSIESPESGTESAKKTGALATIEMKVKFALPSKYKTGGII